MNRRVLTIDGPAGSGKSTTARALARRLGWRYLDTGAMYRAMTVALWERLRANHAAAQSKKPTSATSGRYAMPSLAGAGNSPVADPEADWLFQQASKLDPASVASMLTETHLEVRWRESGGITVEIDGALVPESRLRSEAVSRTIKVVADHPEVRHRLVTMQRRLAEERAVVTEGRDQGSIVFPDAAYKFYFQASIEERARRRAEDAKRRGEETEVRKIQEDVANRDEADKTRRIGRLVIPDGSIVLNTTVRTPDQVVDAVLAHKFRIDAELDAPDAPALVGATGGSPEAAG